MDYLFAAIWNLLIALQYIVYYITTSWYTIRKIPYRRVNGHLGPEARRISEDIK